MEIIYSIIYYLLLILYLYTIITCISVILLDNRSPVKQIAWILCLIFLPAIGLIIYFFLGRNYRIKKFFSQKDLELYIPNATDSLNIDKISESDLSYRIQKTAKLLNKSGGSNIYKNSTVSSIVTGDIDQFEILFEDIKNAKDHIHIDFFIIEDDNIGNQFRRLLISKAQERIKVRIIYDYLGSFKLTQAYKQSLINEGVFIRPFLPVNQKLGISKINYRNHRKIIIIDGKIGYTGGINMADRYVSGNRLGKWRDTMVRMEGAAVYGLQNIFLMDWYFVDNKMITNKKYFPETDIRSSVFVQNVHSGPDTDWETILQGIISVFNNARKHIYIHSPYFLPPESLMITIEMAALSGVDVRIIIPKKSDTLVASTASTSYFMRVLKSGARIFYYNDNFLHSKAITVDDEIAIIGTANMDNRSYEQNYEVNAFIYDSNTAIDLRKYFETDLKSCSEVTIEELENKTTFNRIKESFARLFSPLL